MESIGRLAGGVAHDFNNMLQAILGYAEMALEQVEPGLPLHADLQEIQKAAQRSAALTRQLQAFARKQPTAPQVLDLNKAVENMSGMLRRLIGEGIHLVWKLDPSPCLVKVDPSQLDQVVANLFINARDAIEKSGHISIETRVVTIDRIRHTPHGDLPPGPYAVLSVRDDGNGMPPEVVAHLFEPFFTTKLLGRGTGLGLSTVYGIVTQNQGGIQVQSEPGKGSTFEIFLPRQTEAPPEAAPTNDSELSVPGGDETILLVDDELTILQTTRRILESLGYEVLATQSAEEAIRLAEQPQTHVDLLVTDVIMPDISGPELVRRLIKRHPMLRCLYMSGYTANLLFEQGVKETSRDFISKPFSRNTLARKVREALDAP
jgi:CheY-like chemotaxis protein